MKSDRDCGIPEGIIDSPSTGYDGTIFLYYGDISRVGYDFISAAFEVCDHKQHKVCLILITHGGDPDAAYRIARAANHHFDEVEILIPDLCKSAGTLLCVGAHKLIFGDRGELGPLDIQLSKPDEMFENMSGLDIIQAINALQNQALDAFRTYLIDIRAGSRIGTKMAAEIAAKLADGFVAPIAARIDPLTLGEHQRAMQIAYDYGERLSNMTNSLKEYALIRLISNYPCHGFVIDRKEAGELFCNVSAPDALTFSIYQWARSMLDRQSYPSVPIVMDVTHDIVGIMDNKTQENENECGNCNVEKIEGYRPTNDGQSKSKGKENESNTVQPGK